MMSNVTKILRATSIVMLLHKHQIIKKIYYVHCGCDSWLLVEAFMMSNMSGILRATNIV